MGHSQVRKEGLLCVAMGAMSTPHHQVRQGQEADPGALLPQVLEQVPTGKN